MTSQKRLLGRALAAALCASLVALSPGLEPYRLLAQTIEVPLGGAQSGQAGSAGASAIGPGGATGGASIGDVSLGATLPGMAPIGLGAPALPEGSPSASLEAAGQVPVRGALPSAESALPAGGGQAAQQDGPKAQEPAATPGAGLRDSLAGQAAPLKDAGRDRAPLLHRLFDRVRGRGPAAQDVPADPVSAARQEHKRLKTELKSLHETRIALDAQKRRDQGSLVDAVARGLTGGGGAHSDLAAFYRTEGADVGADISAVSERISALEKAHPELKGKSLLSRLTRPLVAKAAAPFKEFNSHELWYLGAQSAFFLSFALFLSSLPMLVAALTGSTALTGVVRTVHYWTLGSASLFAGHIVEHQPMKRVLVGTAFMRVATFSGLGLVALGGAPMWTVALILVGVNSLVVSMNHLVDIDAAGAAKIFDSDKKIEKANYLFDLIAYVLIMVLPPLVAIPIDAIAAAAGPGAAAFAGFLTMAVIVGANASIYAFKIKVINEKPQAEAAAASPEAAEYRRLRRERDSVRSDFARGAALLAQAPPLSQDGEFVEGLRLLQERLVELDDQVAALERAHPEWTFMGRMRLRLGRLRDRATAFWRGPETPQSVELRRLQAELKAARTEFARLAARLPTAPLPPETYGSARDMVDPGTRREILGAQGIVLDLEDRIRAFKQKHPELTFRGSLRRGRAAIGPAWKGSAPYAIWQNGAIRSRAILQTIENFTEDAVFVVALTTFAFDVLLLGATGSAWLGLGANLGGLIAAKVLLDRAPRIQERVGVFPFVVILSVLASLTFLPSIALWTYPALAASLGAYLPATLVSWRFFPLAVLVPAVMLMKLLSQPIRSRMRAMLQTELKNDPLTKDRTAKVFSFLTVFSTGASGLGSLLFAGIFLKFGAGIAMMAMTGALVVMGAMTLAMLPTLYRQIYRTHYAHPDRKKAAEIEAKGLEKLATNLKRMGLGPYRTEVVEEKVSDDRPTVAILSPGSVYKLAIAQEGGRQSPGDVHLALDPSWFTQETTYDGKTVLWLKKGLYFDAEGRPVIAEYKHPRRVRYFANFYTLGGNDRDDGVPLERNLDAPMSSSSRLEKVTNDKLLTRLRLAARSVGVPVTTAFLLAGHPLMAEAGRGVQEGPVSILAMPSKEAGSRTDQVRSAVASFLGRFLGPELVVKPSGPQFHSGVGVEFFPREQAEGAAEHALKLVEHERMTQDGVVLVDSRISPPPLYLRVGEDDGSGTHGYMSDPKGSGRTPFSILPRDQIASAAAKDKKDWNFRVLAARAPWGKGVTTGIFARAGAWGGPTTAEPQAVGRPPEDAAIILSLDDTIGTLKAQHGLLQTEAEERGFREALDAIGRQAIEALWEDEAQRKRADGEPYQAQTDFIGLDVMVEVENGRLVPKIIEVNDHDSGGQWQMDLMDPENAGAHSREWVATMLARARRDAMKGKRLVLVGAGYQGKRFFFERAKEFGLKIVLVDKPGSWAKDLVDEFIEVDTTEPEEALGQARKKLLKSARKIGKLDGITTFWEDDVVLTARLAEAMGLPQHPVHAAVTARDKFLTRQYLEEAGFETTYHRKLTSPKDIEDAIQGPIPYPVVVKPRGGAEAQSTIKANDETELREAISKAAGEVATSDDPVFAAGREIFIDEYLDGPEWDSDFVLQDGEVVYLPGLIDNWPTAEPFFVATGASMPSRVLTPAQQMESAEMAAQIALGMGFTDGVFHFEGKYTSRGPRLIEANVRPGGAYIVPWHKSVWGVDLAEMLFLTGLRIPAVPYKAKEPRTYLEGEFLFPTDSGILAALDGADAVRQMPGFRRLSLSRQIGDRVNPPPHGYDRVGMLVSGGRNPDEAQASLQTMLAHLKLRVDQP